MALEMAGRNYTMSDADLAMFTSNLCINLTADLAALSLFGVTAPKILELKTLGDAFEIYPSDYSLLGLVEIATRTKDEKAELVRQLIRDNSTRFELCFGVKSAEWDRLGISNLNNFTDKELLFAGRRVIEVSREYLVQLGEYGLTEDILDDMEVDCENFEEAINGLMNASNNRQQATKTRIEKGNELYALVVKYCEIGKRYWYSRDPVKYNQYIIYIDNSPGTLTAPQNFMFDPVNYDFSWSAVANATSYILQQSIDGTNWTEYWAGAETTCGYEESPTTMMYFRVLARNAGGNGPASSVIQYDFAPVLVAPSNFNYNSGTFYFSWNAVPNAEYYEFQYRAQINPTWNSLNAGSATSFYHADPPGDYLARVRAVAGTTMGPWSVEEEYSVGAP